MNAEETYICRVDNCERLFDTPQARRSHEGRSHPGEPTRYWQDKAWLKRKYVDENCTTGEIARHIKEGKTAVLRWLHEFDIPIRGVRSGRDSHNFVEYAEFYTLNSGYEMWRSQADDAATVGVHRLAAIAWYGYDAVVDRDVHHTNNIPWDNRENNLEPLPRDQHGRITAGGRERDWHGRFV